MDSEKTKRVVKERYGQIASASGCCSGCGCGTATPTQIAKSIGYTEEELQSAPDANLGLGCGNPTALGEIKNGDTVLDLGSGAGFDCFLAAEKVGKTGRVIGVDITEEMIEKAKKNAIVNGHKNVEFRLGDIEHLPVEDSMVDVIITNCVINLAPNKQQAFNEAYRVLKSGGRIYLSDIVLLKELSAAQRNDEDLLAGCVGGASLRDEYVRMLQAAGFTVNILSEDRDIGARQYGGLPLESIKLVATK